MTNHKFTLSIKTDHSLRFWWAIWNHKPFSLSQLIKSFSKNHRLINNWPSHFYCSVHSTSGQTNTKMPPLISCLTMRLPKVKFLRTAAFQTWSNKSLRYVMDPMRSSQDAIQIWIRLQFHLTISLWSGAWLFVISLGLQLDYFRIWADWLR